MIRVPADQRSTTMVVLSASLASWLLLAASAHGLIVPVFCTTAASVLPTSRGSWDLLLALNPPRPWMTGWMVMVAAMMLPTLYHALLHVRYRVLRRQRYAALGSFLAGYALVWTLAGFVMLGLSMAAALLMPPGWSSFVAALLIALIWQATPAKQQALNRCHLFPSLSASGPAMMRDTILYGATRGGWCLANCWALMLIPLFVDAGHVPIMLAVALWLYGEQLERPRAPEWGWRIPRVLARIIHNRLLIPAAQIAKGGLS